MFARLLQASGDVPPRQCRSSVRGRERADKRYGTRAGAREEWFECWGGEGSCAGFLEGVWIRHGVGKGEGAREGWENGCCRNDQCCRGPCSRNIYPAATNEHFFVSRTLHIQAELYRDRPSEPPVTTSSRDPILSRRFVRKACRKDDSRGTICQCANSESRLLFLGYHLLIN